MIVVSDAFRFSLPAALPLDVKKSPTLPIECAHLAQEQTGDFGKLVGSSIAISSVFEALAPAAIDDISPIDRAACGIRRQFGGMVVYHVCPFLPGVKS